MDDGRIVHAGDMAELAADAALQERLIGLAMEASMSAPGHTPTLVRPSLAARLQPWLPVALVPLLAAIGLAAIGEPSTWLTLSVAGLAMGMMIFIMASGLTLIFGLMDVINFGHGAFISVGAFVGVTALLALSRHDRRRFRRAQRRRRSSSPSSPR